MIADTEIDFDQMTTLRGGQTVALTRQTLGILRALHAAGGEIVSKDVLIEQVWNGRIVTDATLSTAIKEARRAVGDSGNAQRVIKTVHGVGFRLSEAAKPVACGANPQSQLPCLIVLPFRSLSTQDGDQSIADGFSEEITSNLTRFRNLRVLSQLTGRHIQESRMDHMEVAQHYGVDFVLEGSLRRSPERLRVTIQVSDANSGEIALMEQFDRSAQPQDIFDLQTEIGLLTAGRVGSQHGDLGTRIRRRAASGQTQTWDVYTAVSKFYEFYKTYDPGLHLELRDTLPSLLQADHGSSDGWAAYAHILLEERRYHLNERPGVDPPQLALASAQRGVDCDPQSGFARMVLALCQFHTGDLASFRDSADRALKLNPGHADILAEIGHCHAFLGDFDRAIPLLDRAIDLSPIHPGWYHYAHAWRFALGDFWQAALLEIEKVPMKGFPGYHAHLAWFHAELGNLKEAEADRDELLSILPDFEKDMPDEIEFNCFNGPLVQKALDGWRKIGLSFNLPDGKAIATKPQAQ
ncbi:MAG: winged helix-turn-helix domain-containing protein [Pseudomonadota bacterium]